MASEYIQYLIKDEKPAEAPPPLSPKERRKNWLYYHKWHLIIGAVLIVIALDLLRSALHIGEVEPDLQIAYVGTAVLPDDIIPALEALLQCSSDEIILFPVDLHGSGETFSVLVIHCMCAVPAVPDSGRCSVCRRCEQSRDQGERNNKSNNA